MIELNDYKDKLFIKWKVLKDINKKIFLSNNKRCAINERINSIINELVIVNSNMNAISLEISTYLNLIDASNIKIIDITIEFLTKRYNTLKEYLHTIKIKNKNEDITIENIVYMELLRRGYTITVGKSGAKEVDFICQKQDQKVYVQVTYLLASEETIQREFGIYDSIHDNFPKYVVSMDELDFSRNGIKHWNIKEFLLLKEWN